MVASKTLLQLLSLLIAVMAQEPTDLSYGSGVSANLTAATRIRLNAVWDYMVKGNGNIADQVQILYVKGLNNFVSQISKGKIPVRNWTALASVSSLRQLEYPQFKCGYRIKADYIALPRQKFGCKSRYPLQSCFCLSSMV